MNYLSELFTKSDKNTSKKIKTDTIFSYQAFVKIVVPKVGLEPTRYRYRWILSPVRLPVSPLGHAEILYEYSCLNTNIFYFNN